MMLAVLERGAGAAITRRGRAVWTVALWSLEMRILIALLLLLWVLYKSHVIDEAARLFFIRNLEQKFKLPIQIDVVRMEVWSGTLEFRGVRMLAPPKDVDKRWHYDKLISADSVVIVCDPMMFFHFFIASSGKVISVIGVYVKGVQFYLEGYIHIDTSLAAEGTTCSGINGSSSNSRSRSKISSRKQPVRSVPSQGAAAVGGIVKPVYNFKLVGGEVKKRLRRRQPTLRDLQRSNMHHERSARLRLQQLRERREGRQGHGLMMADDAAGSFSVNSDSNSYSKVNQSGRAVVSTSVPVPRLAAVPLPHSPGSVPSVEAVSSEKAGRAEGLEVLTPGNKAVRSSLFGMVSKANSYMKEATETKGGILKYTTNSLSRIVTEYNAEVKSSGGIMAHAKSKASSVMKATAAKLDGAYQSAKERIKVSYGRKIVEFHEKLRGGEPIPDSRDGYLHLVELSVESIEVHLRNVLPARLRPLEKTSFIVPEILIEAKEYTTIRGVIDPCDRAGKRLQQRKKDKPTKSDNITDRSTVNKEHIHHRPNEVKPGTVSAIAAHQQLREATAVSSTPRFIGPTKAISGIGTATATEIEDKGRGGDGSNEGASACSSSSVNSSSSSNIKGVLEPDAEEVSFLESVYSFVTENACLIARNGYDIVDTVAHFRYERFRHRLQTLLNTSHRESAGLPGVPICVLVYRLERVLLSEMLKDNAGRVINDAVSDWWVGGSSISGKEQQSTATPDTDKHLLLQGDIDVNSPSIPGLNRSGITSRVAATTATAIGKTHQPDTYQYHVEDDDDYYLNLQHDPKHQYIGTAFLEGGIYEDEGEGYNSFDEYDNSFSHAEGSEVSGDGDGRMEEEEGSEELREQQFMVQSMLEEMMH